MADYGKSITATKHARFWVSWACGCGESALGEVRPMNDGPMMIGMRRPAIPEGWVVVKFPNRELKELMCPKCWAGGRRFGPLDPWRVDPSKGGIEELNFIRILGYHGLDYDD